MFDRIDYGHPNAYVTVSATFGKPSTIRAIAATLRGATELEKLKAIHGWIHSHLVYKADAPDAWRNVDDLVRDGNYGGCADHSVIFGALSRALGIPTVWVKTLDANWIREFRRKGTEGHWNGHVFLEVFVQGRWMLLDDVTMQLYPDYQTSSRILPGNRYAYDKGGDPYELVLSSRWELWKKQTRSYFGNFDLALVPVGEGVSLLPEVTGARPAVANKYPAVFLFYSTGAQLSARPLAEMFYPKLTRHLTTRPCAAEHLRAQVPQAKAGDTIVLMLLPQDRKSFPAELDELLPVPWPEVSAGVETSGTATYRGVKLGFNVVALVARDSEAMARLSRETAW